MASQASNEPTTLSLQIESLQASVSVLEGVIRSLQIQMLSNLDDLIENSTDRKLKSLLEPMVKVPLRRQIGRIKAVNFSIMEASEKLKVLQAHKLHD